MPGHWLWQRSKESNVSIRQHSLIQQSSRLVTLAAEEQAVLLAVEAKKRAWLAELKANMEQDLEVSAYKLRLCTVLLCCSSEQRGNRKSVIKMWLG